MTFSIVGWSEQVSVVLDGAGLCDSPFHHVCREIVAVAQVGEADDVIFRFTVADQSDAWNNFNTKALGEERALLSVDFAELRFHVLRSENPQMLVDDLAPFGDVAVEVTNDVIRLLRNFEELLLVDQL